VRWVQEKRGGLKLRKSREERVLSVERLQAQLKTAEEKLAALAGPQNGQGWLPDIDALAKECARLGYLPDTGTLQFALTAIFNLRNSLPAPPTGDAPTEKKL